MQEHTNQAFVKIFEENSDKKRISGLSQRLSKLSKKISIFSSPRDSSPDVEPEKDEINKDSYQPTNIILSYPEKNSKNNSVISFASENEEDFERAKHHYKNNSTPKQNLVKIKFAVKRFVGIGKERRRHREAYHQDGKTNPFE